jgi:hypothetical protein
MAVALNLSIACSLTKTLFVRLPEQPQGVGRGKVCTIRASRSGLYLSKRSSWRAKLGGSVWAPRELHQYEQVKDLAARWKAIHALPEDLDDDKGVRLRFGIEQLGMKLERGRGFYRVLVIDDAHRPTPN